MRTLTSHAALVCHIDCVIHFFFFLSLTKVVPMSVRKIAHITRHHSLIVRLWALASSCSSGVRESMRYLPCFMLMTCVCSFRSLLATCVVPTLLCSFSSQVVLAVRFSQNRTPTMTRWEKEAEEVRRAISHRECQDVVPQRAQEELRRMPGQAVVAVRARVRIVHVWPHASLRTSTGGEPMHEACMA